MIHVQLSDDLKTVIAVFACSQEEIDYPNQMEIEDDDDRYLAFISLTTMQQQL